ncbi:MAG: ABC transporter permease [Anaerolineae bacterium]|jgi:peptide/nickel transport system permease protein
MHRLSAGRAGRLGVYGLTLFLVLTIDFLLPRLLPGDPIRALYDPDIGATALSSEAFARLEEQYGLDQPLLQQYRGFWGRLLRADLGRSIYFNHDVWGLIRAHLPWTLLLGGTALGLASLAGVLWGAQAAWRRGSWFDRASLGALTLLDGLPSFFLGILLILAFAVTLRWLPLSGARTPFAQGAGLGAVADIARHLVLPAGALALSMLGGRFLLVRNSMVRELGQDYVLLARAKGLPEGRVKLGHALRNAILPFVHQFAIQVGLLVTGSVFVETLFAYPGLGHLLVTAVSTRDYPLIEGLFLVVSLAMVLANVVADLCSRRLDPRLGAA